jgi:uncharacterized protein YndB with AHSA1/START domain
MATARASADLPARPATVYAVVADPSRLPAWDPTYDQATAIQAAPGEEPSFTAHRILANREMRLTCRVLQAEPPTHFAFECGGDAGEQVREDFQLAPTNDGTGTRLTRESDYALGGVDPIGVVPGLTYAQAWLDRDLEQAFAQLGALVGTAGVDPANGAPDHGFG